MKKWTKRTSISGRAMAIALCTAMLAGSIQDGRLAYAAELDGVTSGLESEGAAPDTNADAAYVDALAMQTVSQSDADVLAAMFAAAREGDYTSFTTDELVANLNFGTEIPASPFDGIKGFYDITWSEAQGWVDGVYYPRERTKTPGAAYVQAADGCLAITSRVWTETESTGQGTYTYEETSSFDMTVANADYLVQVTLTNPTNTEYTAYLEAEDVTKLFDKASGFTVAPGATVTKEFTTVVIDGELSLKFLAETETGGAQTVYVSNVKVTRLATNAVGQKPTVYLASDSTVQTYEDYYDPQTGWGETLALFFGGEVQERPATDCQYSQARVYEAENVIVENRAIGGRSSRSFVEEGKLEDLLEDIRPGDYLFVQWGHNDATKTRPNRYVSPSDFGQWIQYYIDGARQRGAIPVLVTPVARYSFSDKENAFVGNFEEYGDVMRTMGPQQGVPVIDLTARSVALCNSFGKDGAKSLFLMVEAGEYAGAWAGGANDSTHLQWYGAYKFAQCVAQGIQENSGLSDLASKVVMQIPDKVPGKVTGFKSVTVGASSVTLGWDAADGAELYYIYRKELAAGETADSVDFSTAEKYSVSSKAGYTDSGCESGVTYVYAVRGFNEKGLGDFSDKVTVKTKEAGYKFDFNYQKSPTLSGWIGVGESQVYDDAKGYGFTVAPGNGRDRGVVAEVPDTTGPLGEMGRDFVLGNSIFEVKLPNGDYEVTLYAADLIKGGSTIKSNFTAEGGSIGTVSAKQSIGSLTATVRVTDGKLTIGNDGYMTGMTVTQVLAAPTGLTAFEPAVQGSNYTFQLNFTGVDEATSYNVYRKGTTDKDFALVKSFTVQQDKDDQLGCRAQSVRLGDTYQYYMTCVTPIGESAPSEICTIKAVLDGVPVPAAPQNVRCTDPAEGATDLQRYVTIEWDPVGSVTGTTVGKTYNVILYNIYRSDKAEGEKGFKEFVKVGIAEGTSFTDDTVATNIPYYYKVTAVNAGGEGEKSEACKTPVTGSFVTGGRESYSDRALVAVNLSGGKGAQTLISATGPDGQELTSGVYLSWRAYEADMNGKELNTSFDVYCNGSIIASGVKVTNMVYEGGTANDVFKVVGSNDGAIGIQSVDTRCWSNQYLDLNLYCPADETMPDGTTCNFSANDMSVGDLDGDGILELIVKWYPSNAQDNSKGGYTGNTYLDGYDINWATGEVRLLWRINLGVNIRSGAHYTQFQVWDYDGDGKAEIAVKTGDGTTSYRSTDGTLAGLERADSDKHEGYVGAADDTVLTISENHGAENCDYRAASGYIPIAEGHEFFSIFNGEDGTKAANDVAYEPFGGNATAWGDSSDGYRNRIDRFLSATAYLDGETPFAVFCRGYYTRTCLTAYYMKDADGDGVGDTIDIYWKFDTKEAGSQYEAQGNHGLSVNDVDNDGMDEILYGSLCIDHDGTVKWCTYQQHGDAMHVSDWIPWNPGLEVMQVHEDQKEWDVEIHDAETGQILMGYQTGRDTGRGVAADIDPTSTGAEWWAIAGPNWKPEGGEDEPSWDSTRGVVYSAFSKGKDNLIELSPSTPASNFSIFWDGDLLSEVLDHKFDSGPYVPIGVVISKWDYENSKQETMLYSEEIWSNNGTKGNVGLAADILGDWREEILTRTSGNPNVVRLYTTTIQTDYVVPCLLQNLAYREGVAWQNVGYNQPANLSYLLSEGLVTSQLSEGEVNSEDAEINFTKANDGVYGHAVTGYEIYRKSGDGSFEKVATLGLDDLVESTGGSTGPENPGGGNTESNKEVIFEEDFEDTGHTFKLIADGNSAWEYWEKDTSTVNTNASGHVYGVGARGGGDTGTQLATALGISENVTVAFDLKMDACMAGKSSNYSLLGAACKSNWLASDQQILTISASSTANGYWNTITVNGQDITASANINNGTANGESSGKGGLNRDTTGWLRVVAELDFDNQKIGLTITRISDSSQVYSGDMNFVNNVTSLEYIYMAAAKQYGGVFTDNIEIYKEKEIQTPPGGDGNKPDVTTYVYKDTGLAPVTAYSYKVAAIVDGKTSFMSRPLDIETADKLAEVPALDPVTLYVGTPIEKGETVASLLPQTIKVTTAAGEKRDYQITWNTGILDIMQEGEYDVTGKIKGWPDPLPLHVTVKPNAVKGYVPFEDMKSVVGYPAELPKEVEIEWLNTTKTKKKVIWDTSNLNTSVIGTYTVEGTVEGTTDKVTIKVLVTENYITRVPRAAGEVIYCSENVGAQLPTTVYANYAQGDPRQVAVTWNAESVSTIDTSIAGTYIITGTAEGFDEEVTAEIKVVYRPVYKFDFGVDRKEEAEGWTGFTVNAKGGTKTAKELGIDYNQERGYGFLDGTAVVEGRSENYDYVGVLPKVVYKDFMIPDGQTFVVDLPDGKYEVEVVSGSAYKSDVKGTVEGISANVSSTAGTYAIKAVQVELTDGQLTFEFPGGHICRLDAIVVRLIEADKTALKAAIDSAEVLKDSELLYTEDSWAAFKTALTAAKAVYDNVYPSGEEVVAATKALAEAQAALKVDPNAAEKLSKAALKKAIAAAKALEPEKELYTEESWAKLAEKLAAAQAVLDKADAANQERDDARAALQAAQAALVKKPVNGVITGVVKPDDIRLNTGMTVEELLTKLPAMVDVTFADGTAGKAAATWDVSGVQTDQTGVYDIVLTVDGWSEPIVCKLILTKKVAMDVEASENVPVIQIPQLTDEQLRAILSEEDLEKLTGGADIRLSLAADCVEDAAIDGSVLTSLNEKLTQNGLTAVIKLDLELLKYINGETPRPITEAKMEIPLVITIPEEYRTAAAGYDREFYMVRTHVTQDSSGNEIVLVDVLKDQDNDSTTITIATDKFSIYALSYKDVLVETDETEEDADGQSIHGSSSKTGDEMNVWIWIILLAACVAGAAAVLGVKFYRNKKQK